MAESGTGRRLNDDEQRKLDRTARNTPLPSERESTDIEVLDTEGRDDAINKMADMLQKNTEQQGRLGETMVALISTLDDLRSSIFDLTEEIGADNS